ncbi:MAG: hypothetical protein CMG61_06855 [Candidatus Marinimicrobia bacterium]|nr:hypothetical protein [Candidatus Neomarinimicrobiota bacterium]
MIVIKIYFKKGENMKNLKSIIIGFLGATCLFLFVGMTSTDIEEKKKWLKEFPQNGRYLPLKINQNEVVVMMDSQTGDLYFPSENGWKLDMKK